MIGSDQDSIVPGLSQYIWLLSGGAAILLAILFRGRGPRIGRIEAASSVLILLFLPKLGLLQLFFGSMMARLSVIYLSSNPSSMIYMAPALTVSLISIAKFVADRLVRSSGS